MSWGIEVFKNAASEKKLITDNQTLPTRVPNHRLEPSHFLDPSARSVRKADIVALRAKGGDVRKLSLNRAANNNNKNSRYLHTSNILSDI